MLRSAAGRLPVPVKRTGGLVLAAGQLVGGLAAFAFSSQTSYQAHQALIRLFCWSGGWTNGLLSKFVAMVRPPYRLPAAHGVLGNLSSTESDAIQEDLKAKGYHVFKCRLPAEMVDRLARFALETPCSVRERDGEASPALAELTVYDPANPKGVRYDFRADDLVNNPDVQELLSDPSILAVAQRYLGSQPIIDVIAMWWHTSFQREPDSNAAQLFHFDMDRIRWIKFFFYLNDVTTDNGPHTFVEGSHRDGGIPSRFSSRGYARIADSEVLEAFGEGRLKEMLGPAGTILAEDTRGLHKGKHVLAGHRLLFQIQFSNSLFGASFSRPELKIIHSERLIEFTRRYPRLFSWIRREGPPAAPSQRGLWPG